MITYITCNISAHTQKVGRAEFVVISRFCGYETIMQKLTRLMEEELAPQDQVDEAQNSPPKT